MTNKLPASFTGTDLPLLSNTADRLAHVSDTPELDASVLLAEITGRPRTWVMAHPELTLTTDQKKNLAHSLKQLEDGEPFPYVLGHWEFFGIRLGITRDVLIPRPETETLVEKAISWLQASSRQQPQVADVGTGSGAIAISIALHVPGVHIHATDISRKTLEVAKHNAQKYNVQDQIEFIECDLLPTPSIFFLHPPRFDLICANLPYIPTRTLHTLAVFGKEPTIALDGGDDGLSLIRRLFGMIPDWFAPRGMILLEIEAAHGSAVISLAEKTFPGAAIHLHQDLAGRDRLLEIVPK